jgi:palmitoyltransferase
VNCVGLLNYKFFLQFLAYTFVASVMAIACLIKPMLTFFQGTVGSG